MLSSPLPTVTTAMTIFPLEVSWNTCPEQPACIEKPKTVHLGEENIDFLFKSKWLTSELTLSLTAVPADGGKDQLSPHLQAPGETSLPWIWEYRKFVSPRSNNVSPLEADGLVWESGGWVTRWFQLEVNQSGGLMKTTLLASFERSMALFRQDSPQGIEAREDFRSLPLAFIGRSCCKLSWSGLETSLYLRDFLTLVTHHFHVSESGEKNTSHVSLKVGIQLLPSFPWAIGQQRKTDSKVWFGS